MATVKEKRKKIQDLIYGFSDRLDKTGLNTEKYKAFFSKMTDEQFTKWANKFFKSDDENFYFELLPYKNEPVIQDLKKTATYLGVPLDEYIYFRHNGNKDNPIRSKTKVPTGLIAC